MRSQRSQPKKRHGRWCNTGRTNPQTDPLQQGGLVDQPIVPAPLSGCPPPGARQGSWSPGPSCAWDASRGRALAQLRCESAPQAESPLRWHRPTIGRQTCLARLRTSAP